MKILAIGDFHGEFPKKLKEEVEKADLVFCTGDLGGSDFLLKIIFKHMGEKIPWYDSVGIEKAKRYVLEDYNSGKKIIEELGVFKRKIYFIPGNWDFITQSKFERNAKLKLTLYQDLVKKHSNLHWWRRGIKKLGNLEILAFGGVVTAGEYTKKNGFYGKNKRKLEKNIRSNKKETKQIMKHGRKNLDILFAHYPPYGVFDVVKYKGFNPLNGKHVGFKGYTEYIKKYKPKLFICGHMHEYQGSKKMGDTLIVATGSAKEGKAVVIDYPEDRKGKIKLRFIK